MRGMVTAQCAFVDTPGTNFNVEGTNTKGV